MENIMNIVLKLAGSLAGVGLAYLAKIAAKELRDFIKQYNLEKFVDALVSAAEQMHKANDEDGSRRLGYVEGMLMEAGYELTEAVRAIIESKVYKLNNGGDEK